MMASERNFRPNPDLRLMEQVRQVLRYHHYKYRTEQTYCKWILRIQNMDFEIGQIRVIDGKGGKDFILDK